MPLHSTRRSVLRSGTVLAATAFAGCSALPGSGTDDPDAGTDSYGIRLQNDTEETYSVTISARSRDGEDVVFEETTESVPDDSQEWDEVLTGERLYVVEATIDDDHFLEELSENVRSVTVGAANSVDARNVLVTVETQEPGVVANITLGRNGE